MPLVAFPASLLLPLVVVRAVATRGYRYQLLQRWAGLALVGIVVVFSLVPQKRSNYMTAIVPYGAVLVGDAVRSLRPSGRDGLQWRAFQAGGVLWMLTLLAAAIALFFYFRVVLASPVSVALLPSAACAVFGVGLGLSRKNVGVALLLAPSSWLFLEAITSGSLWGWHAQFKSGEIYDKPYYDAEHWGSVLREYPFLREMFHRSG